MLKLNDDECHALTQLIIVQVLEIYYDAHQQHAHEPEKV